MKIRIVVIEDEMLVARDLVKLINKMSADAEIVDTIVSVEQGVSWFRQPKPVDLIFADVQLSDGVSFDIFRQVGVDVPVIFTTAYDEYALRAFKLNSIDYLLKPVDENELRSAWEKFLKIHRQAPVSGLSDKLATLLSDLGSGAGKKYKDRFTVHSGSSMISIGISEVSLFKREELILLGSKEGKQFVTDYHSLEELEELLDPSKFFRANRQFIVYLDAVEGYKASYNGKLDLKMKGNIREEITISREKAAQFKEWFGG